MTTNFVFGGLAFASDAILSSALNAAERTLMPALGLGVCSPRVRELLGKARRGPRAFLIEPAERLSFAELDDLAPRLWELAEASSRGRLVIGQMGERPGLDVPSRAETEWREDTLGQPTTRWLVPTTGPMIAYRPPAILEFAWTSQRDLSLGSRPALDVRDWAGFFGLLVECDERIYINLSGPSDAQWACEWADLAVPGIGGVIVFPGKEALVWTEVQPARELRLPTASYSRAVEVVVWSANTCPSAYDLARLPEPSTRCSSLWFVEGRGIVAVNSASEAASSENEF
jgi:hypothetical protein